MDADRFSTTPSYGVIIRIKITIIVWCFTLGGGPERVGLVKLIKQRRRLVGSMYYVIPMTDTSRDGCPFLPSLARLVCVQKAFKPRQKSFDNPVRSSLHNWLFLEMLI